MTAPLERLRVLEVGGIGPVPFAGMVLADMGADVIKLHRVDEASGASSDGAHLQEIMDRGKRSLAIDLKSPHGAELVQRLAEQVDVVIEGFRPGVVERLGIGPEDCRSRNPALVYARMTGWGQDGPYAHLPGHDINYIAVAGVLATLGNEHEAPNPPLSYVGNYGGGAMFLLFGIMCALHEARDSGVGQVVDASMLDGAAVLSTFAHQLRAKGRWTGARGRSAISGSAPFYSSYRCSDGRHVAVGAIEPEFFARLLAGLELDGALWEHQNDESLWPAQRAALATRFGERTQAEWMNVAQLGLACASPVLALDELRDDPHLSARRTFLDANGVLQPAPAPRFSRTPGCLSRPAPVPGSHTTEILTDLGIHGDDLRRLRDGRVVSDAPD